MFRLRTIIDLTKFWDSLTEIFFHNCCHGGQRKKGHSLEINYRCLRLSSQHIAKMTTATCLIKFDLGDGTWTFDTSTQRPHIHNCWRPELQRQSKSFWYPKICPFLYPQFPREKTLAAQHRQHKKTKPTHPRVCHETKWLPPTISLTDQQKLIPSSQRGECQEGNSQERSEGDVLVGTWYTPMQFVEEARNVTHPMDENALEHITRRCD